MRLYNFKVMVWLTAFLVAAPVVRAAAATQERRPEVEAKVQEILQQMGVYLGKLCQFGFQAEVTEDVRLASGQRLQFGRRVETVVRRPDRLRAESVGDQDNRLLLYDGQSFTLLDRTKNFYTTLAAPPELDAALTYALRNFNLRAPLADLVYSTAYENLSAEVESGFYVGRSRIQGVDCHHLAFRQQDIDWQIWVEDSPTPLPRKFQITDKKQHGLQFAGVFVSWQTNLQVDDQQFVFRAPSQAERIEILPATAVPRPRRLP